MMVRNSASLQLIAQELSMAHATHPELNDMQEGYFSTKQEAIDALKDADAYDGPLFEVGPDGSGHVWLYYGDAIRYYMDDPARGAINYLGYVHQTDKGWVNTMVA
jgi:hypothetical protein